MADLRIVRRGRRRLIPVGEVEETSWVTTTSPNKIKIPDACADLRVECITPFAMLREAGARFVRE